MFTGGFNIAAVRRRIRLVCGQIVRRQEGAAALEFAMVGPLMIALLMSMIETGLLYTRIALLDDATSRAAKMVYVGSASGGEVDQEDIEDFICDAVGVFVTDCATNITVELSPITDFDDFPDTDVQCRHTDIEVEPLVGFNPGGGNTIVFMRVCTMTNVVTPGLGIGLQMSKDDENRVRIVSSVAFMNEPF